MSLELGPAAMLRAAAWPCETLDAFGTRECGRSDCEARYAELLARERVALWERTAGDPRFMKALLFTSSSLYARVCAAEGPRALRNKRVRHLETSLYRYLSRAATRAAPNGLWAGVTSVSFGGERDELRERLAEARFSPDLSPFARAFALLATKPAYRQGCEFRLNPTLCRQSDGSFRFFARLADGSTEERRLAFDPVLDAGLTRLAEVGKARLDALARAAALPLSVIEALVNGGVLVGGLAFPNRFSSAWQALERAGEMLQGAERAGLTQATARLRELCSALAATWRDGTLAQLEPSVTSARQTVLEFLNPFGLAGLTPADPLRCDLRLPFQLSIGEPHRLRLALTLLAYDRDWIATASPASAKRRAEQRTVRSAFAAPEPLMLPFAGDVASGPLPATSAWNDSFAAGAVVRQLPHADDSSSTHEAAPWGCFIARPSDDGVNFVLGVDDSPTRPFSRHLAELDAAAVLEDWWRGSFARARAQHGVNVAELCVPFELNPNVLARPELGQVAIEPWGAHGLELCGARLLALSNALVLAVRDERYIALSLSSANALDRDVFAERLAWTGFDLRTEPGARASAALHPSELASACFSPRFALGDGATLRARRTVLSGERLARLTSLRGIAAQRAWLELGARLGWPERVIAARDGGTGLALELSSPLGLEAALEGAGAARLLIVEEAPIAEFLRGARGNHISELVVPFRRDPNALSEKEFNAGASTEHAPG